jgi:hypothetical protein
VAWRRAQLLRLGSSIVESQTGLGWRFCGGVAVEVRQAAWLPGIVHGPDATASMS